MKAKKQDGKGRGVPPHQTKIAAPKEILRRLLREAVKETTKKITQADK